MADPGDRILKYLQACNQQTVQLAAKSKEQSSEGIPCLIKAFAKNWNIVLAYIHVFRLSGVVYPRYET
jgi:hypothetical protein